MRFVAIHSDKLWDKESPFKKTKAVLRRRWEPSKATLLSKAKEYFINDTFGGVEDYGDKLWELARWHHDRKWPEDTLTPEDIDKAKSLESLTIITHARYNDCRYAILALQLGNRIPEICFLTFPMIVK